MTCPDCRRWYQAWLHERETTHRLTNRLEQLQAANEAKDHRPTGWFNFEDPKPAPLLPWSRRRQEGQQ